MKNCFLYLFCCCLFAFLQSNAQTPQLGVATTWHNDSVVHAAGFSYIEDAVRRILVPDMPEDSFLLQLRQIKHIRIPVCNVFFPNEMRLAGPGVNEQQVLQYTATTMKRARQAGIHLIVLGSGNARNLPAGVAPDSAKAGFISLCRKMAVIAAKYNCVIAIENLNSTETNFITTLQQANEIVNAVHHPNFKLTADIYHMLKEREPAEALEKARANLVHCHIAEREKRTGPGVMGDEVRPYILMLGKLHYKGRISVEARWDDMVPEMKKSCAYLQQLLQTAYQ